MREFFEKEWLPQAMEIGISYEYFWTLNPRRILMEIDAFKAQEKRRINENNFIAHLQGAYMVEALIATVGNMFSKHGNYKYPEKPYSLESSSTDGMSEEEKKNKTQVLFAQLEIMAQNYNLKHKGQAE